MAGNGEREPGNTATIAIEQFRTPLGTVTSDSDKRLMKRHPVANPVAVMKKNLSTLRRETWRKVMVAAYQRKDTFSQPNFEVGGLSSCNAGIGLHTLCWPGGVGSMGA